MNLMMLLEMASSAMGERVAVRCGDASWSQRALFEGAARVGASLRGLAVENVAYLDVASPALPLALFGAAWAGRPFAPLNYRLTAQELDALLERIRPALLITDAARAKELAARDGLSVWSSAELQARARDESARAEPAAADWPMDPEAVAVLLFTSGTTGAPKAAVLRQRHLLSYIFGAVEFMSAGETSANLVSVPPYHVAGLAALLSSVYSGRRIVQLPAFSAEAWLEAAARERVTHAFVVPTMLARIVDALEAGAHAPPALRALAYGGGRMPLPVIERALRCFSPGVGFTNAYGLTETSSTISVLGPDEHRAAAHSDDARVRRRLASVGRPLPGVEVEIRDAAGAPLAPGGAGEVWVRGEQVSGEYRGHKSRRLADGWFPTRDGGAFDEDGFLFIEGRMDDVIVRGGENLSPGEIEDVLFEHGCVADCAVVGVPDEQWGEGVGAAVVLRGDASVADLQEWVRARLRSSRVPQQIEFWERLPYNETGKLLRREVREKLARAAS